MNKEREEKGLRMRGKKGEEGKKEKKMEDGHPQKFTKSQRLLEISRCRTGYGAVVRVAIPL